MQGDPKLLTYVLLTLVVAVVLVLRVRRMGRPRPLRLERLWIAPALLAAATAVVMAEAPPTGRDWLWLALALAVGAGLGWVRGSTMTIAVDPETHALNVKASPAAVVLLVVLIAVRYGLRTLLQDEAQALGLGAALISDLLLVLALGLIAMQRLEMWLRARRLLAAAQAGAVTL